MKSDSKNATFQCLANQLRQGCAALGVALNDGVAEVILADRISALASVLGVSDQHAMRTYFSEAEMSALIEVCVGARAEQQTEVGRASPMVLPVPQAAAVIGALAASCQAATTS